MQNQICMTTLKLAVLTVLALSQTVVAQNQKCYTVTDLGTLGSTSSDVFALQLPGAGLNNKGQVVGSLLLPDNTTLHAFLWQDGVLTDLTALAGLTSVYSFAGAVNERGQVILEAALPDNTFHAFIWEKGVLTDIGNTLGGTSSEAFGINNRGQAVGGAETDVIDPNTGFPASHAFLWKKGVMTDLGTLVGSFSFATAINEPGQVVGGSSHAFLWEQGVLADLGTLGGSFSSAFGINNRGQVVGLADLAGNSESHAFLWEKGVMADLDTLGGSSSFASAINNRGQVVGGSLLAGNTEMHAFVWEKGEMTDLNSLIPGDSGWQLILAQGINDRGQVMGYGLLHRVVHPFLLSSANCNSDEFNGSTALLTRNSGNGASAVNLFQRYRGVLGKASLKGALPWLRDARSKTRTTRQK